MNDQILDVVMPIQFKNTLLIPIKADVEKLFSNYIVTSSLRRKCNVHRTMYGGCIELTSH